VHTEVCLCFACCALAYLLNEYAYNAVNTRLIGSQRHLCVLNDNGLTTSQQTARTFRFSKRPKVACFFSRPIRALKISAFFVCCDSKLALSILEFVCPVYKETPSVWLPPRALRPIWRENIVNNMELFVCKFNVSQSARGVYKHKGTAPLSAPLFSLLVGVACRVRYYSSAWCALTHYLTSTGAVKKH